MAYTTIDDPTAYFQTKTYTGSAGAQSITFDGNSDLQPDWIWIKERGAAGGHVVTDTVRGISASSAPFLQPSATGVEIDGNGTVANRTLTSSNTNGFTLGQDAYYTNFNNNSDTYVSWNWKAGTSFTNDASSTSVGTIDSTGSVNTDAGFSIVKWVGTASNATIAHGLGTTPSVFISKSMVGTHSWGVYHKSIGIGSTTLLNSSGASDADATYYGGTSPTSTIMGLGTANAANASGNMIGYAFAEKQGYSKFGGYTGNGDADGTFVYTGFKPAFVLIKRTDAVTYWVIIDNKRDPFNVSGHRLFPNRTDAEADETDIDFTAQGFKIRTTSATYNASGGSYIYMAFAENPFVTSTGVPATAR